jgi:hypothetical protein
MDLQKQSKKLLYETLSKQFPESSISEKQIEDRARWKWEFLKLNKNYIEKCLALKVETILISPQYNEFGTPSWINPALSFDEILKIVRDDLEGVEVDKKDQAIRLFALYHFGLLSQPVTAILETLTGAIKIQINLNAPDSQILIEVAEILKERRAAIKKDQPYKKLAEYHQAFLLHQAGKTYKEIADVMFPPPDPLSEDDSVIETNEDAAMKNVGRYIQEAKKLIEGGYQHI